MPDENFLIPTVVQDAESGQVLMLAYSNRESLHKSFETGEVHFWSRSRNSLWKKGETSGNRQKLVSASVDCDSDALLFRVHPAGPACHTGAVSCFFTPIEDAEAVVMQHAGVAEAGDTFGELFRLIESRKREKPENSYTVKLLEQGVDRVCKKIAEEAGEVIIAAKNQSREELLWESADLIYHLMVLLARQDLQWSELAAELEKRRK